MKPKLYTAILTSATALVIFSRCANAQTTLFQDTYSRGGTVSSGNLTPNFTGQTGSDVGSGITYLTWTNGANTTPPNSLGVNINQAGTLYKSSTGQEGIWSPNYNFTDAAIVSAGGFSISQNVIAVPSNANQPQDRFCGYGVGMSLTQQQNLNDDNATSSGARGSITGGTTGVASFYVDLDSQGAVQVFTGGKLLASIQISGSPSSGTLETVFGLTSGFNAGTIVGFTVYFNGSYVTNGTFAWNSTGNNYVAGSMRDSTITAGTFNISTASPVSVLDSWEAGAADYTNSADWSTGLVPGSGIVADNDNGTNNAVEINSGDPNWNVSYLVAGYNTNSGAYLQNGQTVTVNGAFGMGVIAGLTGVYTMNGGTNNYNGANFNVGELGTGILYMNGGTITGSGNFADAFGGGTTTDIVNQTGGLINVTGSGQFFVGNGTGPAGSGLGLYNLSGGTNDIDSYFAIGRSGGYGTLNMSGGVINELNSGVFFDVGTGFQGQSPGAIGVLNQSGGTINCQAQFLIPEDSPSTGYYNLSGSGALFVNNWLAIGRSGGNGTLNMNGGSITVNNASTHLTIGSSGVGTLNQTNGAVTNTASTTFLGESGTGTWNLYGGNATLANLEMGVNGGSSGTLNLNGGTLQVSGISTGSGGSEINFQGGTLQANANNVSFISSSISYAQVSSPGGAVIDSQGYNITIPTQLNDNGNGPLTKLGTGTLTLSGQNTYAGTTTVSTGTLDTTTASTGGGAYLVAGSATMGVQVASQNAQLVAGGLTLGSSSTLNIDLNTFGNPSSAPIEVAGALNVSSPVTLNVAAEGPLAVGQFSLVTYSSQSGSANFVLGTLPSGVGGYISNNVNNSSIDLVVTSSGAPRWNGTVNGNWDVNTTANWIDLVTSASETFQNGEPVVFNDSATGTTAINLAATVLPSGVTVNNTALSYSITGAGQINGTGGLLKEGANTLSILNSAGNGYTGATMLGGGILNVTNLANGGIASAIGASSNNAANLVLEGGTLAYSGPGVSINRGYTSADTNGAVDIDTVSNLTLSGTISTVPGTGFTKSGPAQLAYANTGQNTLSDILGYNVQEGTVLFETSGTYVIAGGFDIGSSNSVNAIVALTNSAAVDLTNANGGDLDIADSHGSALTNTGEINQSGGILYVPSGYQTWIGQNSNGFGTYNLSGGAFDANNWVAIGRANGNGTFNLSGSGALNILNGNGGNLDIGTSANIGGDAGSGVLNQSGGTVSNTTAQTWLGEGVSGEPANGTWNMSGGTAWLGELHIGVGGTGTSTLNISGAASITESYLLLANYDSNTTGNVNVGSASQPGGTITVNADMNVGGAGTGTLNFVTNGGGMVTVTGTLYLSRFNATADGTVNLNTGGTLVVSYINNGWAFNEGTNSPTFNPNAVNFNGGTLRAFVGSQFFIQANVNAVVQSGGAIIDDGGNSVWANCTFNDAPGSTGGLTKLGSGMLELTATNTYIGTTVVSNGTLIANSLAGGIAVEPGATLLTANDVAGPVSVASGGTLGGNVGDANTITINNTLTLSAGSTTYMQIAPASNAQIVGLTGVTYGGLLIVSNVSNMPLTVGAQYKLFNSSSPGVNNFSTVTLLPSGTGSFDPATGILTITSAGGLNMNQPYISNGSLILTGTGGAASGNYTLLSSTNLLIPVSNWVTNATGTFGVNGTFSNGLPIAGSAPHQFFILKTQ